MNGWKDWDERCLLSNHQRGLITIIKLQRKLIVVIVVVVKC